MGRVQLSENYENGVWVLCANVFRLFFSDYFYISANI